MTDASFPEIPLRYRDKLTEHRAGGASLVVRLPKFLGEQTTSVDNTIITFSSTP